MLTTDPNSEWLGHVQPVGLVVAPSVLARHGLVPEEQTRLDTEEVAPLLSQEEDGPAVADLWGFFLQVLGWRPGQVAGAPGGPDLPEELSAWLPESETRLAPDLAVAAPGGGWQLLVQLAPRGIDPDARGVLAGWEATPHQRLERLLRETGVPTGLLLTDHELRLVHAPRGETSGWLAFPLRALGSVSGRPMLGGLRLLLSSFRLHNDAAERRLPALLKASREAQAEVSTKLASQVLGALHELLRGLHEADRARIERLAAQHSAHLYEGLLTVLLRLVFLLYAEDRNLVPSATDGEARALYENGYGVRALHARLLEDVARHPDTMDERRGAWSRLLALFRLVHVGHPSGWIRGRGGKLFDPAVFPFLQGQDAATDRAAPAPVSDGCILRVLDGLLNLDGERLSYRTLDVEQIGSVYETVMGFTVLTVPGPALAIKAGKNNRTPVFLDVALLAAKKGTERAKFLKDEADRGQLPAKVAQALSAARDAPAIADALRPIVDERGSPGGHLAAAGTPLLQPTDERRRTGSHYTPRSLTEPIVRHALEPAFARIGDDATPADVLSLKVCDPAMGSGAFLVEACRQLAARLVRAWTLHAVTRPEIPPDEDEELHARRLVAQRCLYGVDKNPRAVDLARLSLWLATLARDHEFTFLDHALKCGDSLVGLTTVQIAAANWDESKSGLPLFRQLVRDKVAKAMTGRAEIQNAPDDTIRAVQEARHHNLEAEVSPIRIIGDAVVFAFFGADKTKAREKARADVESHVSGMPPRWNLLEVAATRLRAGAHGVTPFHWQVEFPEVFARENGGFDAIVGNPPFLGGARISEEFGRSYFGWLTANFLGCRHQCDLAAYFFRRAFSLLRRDGSMGLLATKTLAEGDSREGSLLQIVRNGGSIYRANTRYKWPGDASIIVTIVHICKGDQVKTSILNGKTAQRISAYLRDGYVDESPIRLSANPFYSKGSLIYGQGFLFDDTDPKSSPIIKMQDIAKSHPYINDRISMYLSGEDVNRDPRHRSNRFVINVNDCEDESDLAKIDPIYSLLKEKVFPERMALGDNPNNKPLKARWWAYQAHRPSLYKRIAQLNRVLGIARVTPHVAFAFLPNNVVFAEKVILFDIEAPGGFCVLQSRAHEAWVLSFTSTLGDTLNYAASDCYETFPLPTNFESNPAIQLAGETYHAFRAELMISRDEGLTKTYNRFHARGENAADIVRLRALHHEMDVAVLRAYGWDDLADRAVPEFIEQEADGGKTPKTRLDWLADFKDEVLARLLDLNRARAEEERRLGITARRSATDTDEELEDA